MTQSKICIKITRLTISPAQSRSQGMIEKKNNVVAFINVKLDTIYNI